jgi:hypothetical protein
LGGYAPRRLEPACYATLRMPPARQPPSSLRSQETEFASLTRYLLDWGRSPPPRPPGRYLKHHGKSGF